MFDQYNTITGKPNEGRQTLRVISPAFTTVCSTAERGSSAKEESSLSCSSLALLQSDAVWIESSGFWKVVHGSLNGQSGELRWDER
jgi:hypothetical protein